MKVTSWRRKLAASLIAGGLFVPVNARAASVDANLVVNPGFENVDAVTCCYGATRVLNWSDGTQRGFAYNSAQSYDAGGPLAGGGSFYFTSNAQGVDVEGQPEFDVTEPGQVSQLIDVSTGASGALIASGEGAIRLGAQMTSYLNDFDVGRVQVDFLTAGNVALGSAGIRDLDGGHKNVWNLTTGRSGVPVGTAKLKVSVFADQRTFGPDGYIDNVDVQVTSGLDEVVYLEVNTTNGLVSIKNQTGAAIRMDYYDISSAGSALNLGGWMSLQEQNQAGFPPGNGSGNGWEQAGSASAKAIGEGYLTGKSTLNNGQTLPLGNAFNIGGAHDLVFRYTVEPPQELSPVSDFDSDGDSDGVDFLAWQRGFGIAAAATIPDGDADLTDNLDVDGADFSLWAEEFGGTPTSPNLVVFGSVRYVTGAAAIVPEPGSIILAGLGLAMLATRRRAVNRPSEH